VLAAPFPFLPSLVRKPTVFFSFDPSHRNDWRSFLQHPPPPPDDGRAAPLSAVILRIWDAFPPPFFLPIDRGLFFFFFSAGREPVCFPLSRREIGAASFFFPFPSTTDAIKRVSILLSFPSWTLDEACSFFFFLKRAEGSPLNSARASFFSPGVVSSQKRFYPPSSFFPLNSSRAAHRAALLFFSPSSPRCGWLSPSLLR